MVDKKTGVKPKAKATNIKKNKKSSVKPEQEQEIVVKQPKEVVEVVPAEEVGRANVKKTGKHSAKALKEAEEKQAKEVRKASTSAEEVKPKAHTKPPRSRSERAGKKYREAAKLLEKDKIYTLSEATELAIKTSPSKFDASIELHLNLEVDPKQADQNVRGMVVLPGGSGKTVRIAVLAEGEDASKASAGGADTVGSDTLLDELDKQLINFDTLITTPNMMPRLAKYARLLGPKGLMPNPKSGTVSTDIAKAVSEARGGRVEYRVDQAGIIHLAIGKASFGPEKILQNLEAVLSGVRAAKPTSIKGLFLKSGYLSSTMGPSVKFEI